MKPISELTKNKPWLGWLLFFVTAVVVFLVGLFASSIIETYLHRRNKEKLRIHNFASLISPFKLLLNNK